MKRTIVVAVLLAAGFCAGAASRPSMRWPWAGEKLNQPCNKTELEWRIATKDLRCEPLHPTREWAITHILARPGSGGLLIQANIVRTPGFSDGARARWLQRAKDGVYREVKTRFGGLLAPSPTPGPFRVGAGTEWDHCRLEIYVDGKMAEAQGPPASKVK